MDDVYPNDGTTFYQPEQPESQLVEQATERNRVIAGMPVLEMIIARLQERIAAYDSVDSIGSDVRAHPAVFQKAWEINRGTKANLVAELEYFTNLRDQHKPQD